MKRKRYSEEQIIRVLQEAQRGRKTAELCRAHGISQQTYYRWKRKYGGLQPTDLKRMKRLEDENRWLKKLVADLSLDREALQDVLSRKW